MFGILCLIDTLVGSRNSHYVNRFVRGMSPTGPITISAARVSTGRIAEIAAQLPAIRRQAPPPHGRRDGNRNPIVPARMPSTRDAIDTPRPGKGAEFGHRIRPAGGELRLPAPGRVNLWAKNPRRIHRRGGKGVIGAVCRPAPSLVITLALRERMAAPRWPGPAMHQRWLAGNPLYSELMGASSCPIHASPCCDRSTPLSSSGSLSRRPMVRFNTSRIMPVMTNDQANAARMPTTW